VFRQIVLVRLQVNFLTLSVGIIDPSRNRCPRRDEMHGPSEPDIGTDDLVVHGRGTFSPRDPVRPVNKTKRAVESMMAMKRIDIAALERAADSLV
jgi:hypothetical protein